MAKGHSSTRTATVSKRNDGFRTKVTSTHHKGLALICDGVNHFLQPRSKAYRALLVRRPQKLHNIQRAVDQLAKWGRFRPDDDSAREVVEASLEFELDLADKAHHLASLAVQAGLPHALGLQIEEDFVKLGAVLTNLVPFKRACLSLNIVGENSCSRWHRDHDIGRGLITYNSRGTQFVDHQGNLSAGFVPHQSWVHSAKAGDILFMKGTKFPASPNGLVHRSPPVCWHEDGTVVNRLLLKIDLD